MIQKLVSRGEKLGRITVRNKHMSKSIPFSAVFAYYYLKHLKLYKKHRVMSLLIRWTSTRSFLMASSKIVQWSGVGPILGDSLDDNS